MNHLWKCYEASVHVYQLIIIYAENQCHHYNHQSHLMKGLMLLQSMMKNIVVFIAWSRFPVKKFIVLVSYQQWVLVIYLNLLLWSRDFWNKDNLVKTSCINISLPIFNFPNVIICSHIIIIGWSKKFCLSIVIFKYFPNRHKTSRGRPLMVLFWSRRPGP